MPSVTKDHLSKLHSPTLYLLGGETDIAYNNGMDDFQTHQSRAGIVANMDVGHGGTYREPHGGEFAKVATAWYKWQLKGIWKLVSFTGDRYKLSESTIWTTEKKNMP